MANNGRRTLAEVDDYAGLIHALRQRAMELNITRETIDELAGLPQRYTAKLLGLQFSRALGPISLGPILQALGLRLVVVEDEQAIAKMRPRLVPRKRPWPAERAPIG